MSGGARRILLTPGPLTTSEAVKRALIGPDECPREAEFGDVVARVRAKLLRIGETDAGSHAAILLGGSGTAAVEAALGSLVPRDGRVLIVDNGAYGARAAEIAAALGVPCDVWRLPWTERPAAEEFATRLGGVTHAFWVHHETTTGMSNPLEEFGAACRARGVTSLVDAISSFAGVPLALRAAPIDVAIASANKCVQGLPGVSFVLARRGALAAARGTARSVALDLHRHARMQEEERQFPFTPPVQVMWALECALDETLAETVPARAARYAENYRILSEGLRARGFAPVLRPEWHSRLLTAWRIPAWPDFNFAELHAHLRARDVTLYPGKVPGLESFRTGHIGAIGPEDQRAALAAIDAFLAARGRRAG